MNKRIRTIIFFVFLFFFILTAPLVILYSQGYRFDFDPPAGGKRITQTGAFYFKVLPKGAEIYINGKFEKKTSIISNSIFIKNLLPKTYEIEIKKGGYHPWKKILRIQEKQVTEAKNVILFPENPSFASVEQKPIIETNATSIDKKRVVEYNDYEIWVYFLENDNQQPAKKAGDKLFLTRFSEKIGKVFWLTNYYLIFDVGNKIKIAEIDDRDGINIVDLAEFENPEIFWDQNKQNLYAISEKEIFLFSF